MSKADKFPHEMARPWFPKWEDLSAEQTSRLRVDHNIYRGAYEAIVRILED